MRLEQTEKELAAIGASIGCNCRPCIEHHIAAGREAGLTDTELADAVATARGVRDEAIELLATRVDELLGAAGASSQPAPVTGTSRAHELVALGASVGANAHSLLKLHVTAARVAGLSPVQVAAAMKMAGYVQTRAGEITADQATAILEDLAGSDDARALTVSPRRD